MGRALMYGAPLAVFLALAGYLAFGLTKDPSQVPSVLIDRPAPEFDLPPLHVDGLGLKTADLKGGVTLVNVFASWCTPCRAEHPILMRLAEGGVTVHGLNWKDEVDDAQSFLAQLGDPYARIGHDLDGRAGFEWGVYGVPETYVVDADGRVRFKQIGPITPQALEEDIMPLIERLEGEARNPAAMQG